MLGPGMHCLLLSYVWMGFAGAHSSPHLRPPSPSERARGCRLDWVEINKSNRPTAVVCSVRKFQSWLQTEDCLSLPAACPAREGCQSLLMSKAF